MKLEILTEEGWLSVSNRKKYYTEEDYGGNEIISFDISPFDEIYQHIKNEALVRNDENLYIIKTINRRKTLTSVSCDLYMDEWYKNEPYIETKENSKFQTKSLSDILNSIKPSGWSIQNASIRSIRRTIDLQQATDYDVLSECMKVFDIVYKIDTINKVVHVLDPDQAADTGLYITPQLNMSSIESSGISKDFATRISAYGKQNEDGTYINFASINGGKEYVEDLSYTNKVKWIVWKDERYTIPEELLAAAKKKLKDQAFPVLSYSVGVNDLAKYDPEYNFLNFQLYQIVHTILDESTSIVQKIVKIRRYHDAPEDNVITLSTEAEKLTSKIDKVISILGEDGEKISGSILKQAQDKATELINSWAEKGHVYITENEIYILDKLPKETAKYCIRINLGGIAFSQNGWQGPYVSAWTIDSRFNADFITAGTLQGILLQGNIIKGGRIEGNDIVGSNIVGGTIKGDTTISVGTDLTVGNNINLNPGDGKANKVISLGNGAYIRFNIDDKDGNYLWLNVKKTNGDSSSISVYDNRIYFNVNSSKGTNGVSINHLVSSFGELWCSRLIASDLAAFYKGVIIQGDLSVTGSKNRIVETTKGLVKMNAVESSIAIFEDFGTSQINENGECTIYFDPLFMETVNTSDDYYCFLTPYDTSNAHLVISQKSQEFFNVKGNPGLKFDWRVTVKQKGYENVRMEIYKEE